MVPEPGFCSLKCTLSHSSCGARPAGDTLLCPRLAPTCCRLNRDSSPDNPGRRDDQPQWVCFVCGSVRLLVAEGCNSHTLLWGFSLLSDKGSATAVRPLLWPTLGRHKLC